MTLESTAFIVEYYEVNDRGFAVGQQLYLIVDGNGMHGCTVLKEQATVFELVIKGGKLQTVPPLPENILENKACRPIAAHLSSRITSTLCASIL